MGAVPCRAATGAGGVVEGGAVGSSRGDGVSAGFTGFAAVFVLGFPWLRRVVFDRIVASVFKFTGRTPKKSRDDMVIDGEFRERKD